MSINNKLKTFATQELVLNWKAKERDKIKGTLGTLELTLKARLGDKVVKFIRFGSFTRNTILPRKYDRKSDVDLMIVMNTYDYDEFTPNTYRNWIIKVVEACYPNSLSKKDFPVVKLEFKHIMFDLVPAIIEKHWLSGESIYIPDSGNDWIETVPNDLNPKLIESNKYYEDNMVRNVVRLMKYWNASRNYPFQSYLLEKDLVKLNYDGEDTYSGFLYALKNVAYNYSNTEQALLHIKEYRRRGDYAKELEWVRRLLPNL
jgi:hypothetical protein